MALMLLGSTVTSDSFLDKKLYFLIFKSGCKENHFYSLPVGQIEATIY